MSHWERGINLKIRFQDDLYRRRIARLLELSDRLALDLVKDTAKRFAGHARNATPPDKGQKKISREKAYRPIKYIGSPEAWTGEYGKMNRNAHFGRNRYDFAVPFRRPKHSGVMYFVTRREAEAFSPIPNRGAARYGWAQALPALGGKVPAVTPAGFPFAKNRKILMGLTGSTEIRPGKNPFVAVENHADAAGPMHLLSSRLAGLHRANSGLERGIRQAEKKLKQRVES